MKDYFIIESQNKFKGKARISKIKATDPTSALLKFKDQNLIKNLPYHTMIIPKDQICFYPKGV